MAGGKNYSTFNSLAYWLFGQPPTHGRDFFNVERVLKPLL